MLGVGEANEICELEGLGALVTDMFCEMQHGVAEEGALAEVWSVQPTVPHLVRVWEGAVKGAVFS